MYSDRVSRGLGVENQSLDALRNQAARDPKGAARQAAVQFESQFMQMVLKSMRDASAPQETSQEVQTFTGMLDAQMAKQFSGRPNGLADVIERQLSRHIQGMPKLPDTGGSSGQPTQPVSGAAPVSGRTPVQTEFMQKMMPFAKEAERQTGVPATYILGQAALESGWGRREIRNADGSTSFNLFGIKSTASWGGQTTDANTREYQNGEPVRQVARFRSYGSYSEAFTDYARLLSGSPRYANVVRNATSGERFADGMQRAGYATDPQYAAKLTRTINQALAVQRAMG